MFRRRWLPVPIFVPAPWLRVRLSARVEADARVFRQTSSERFVAAALRLFAQLAKLAGHQHHVAMPPILVRIVIVCVLSWFRDTPRIPPHLRQPRPL